MSVSSAPLIDTFDLGDASPPVFFRSYKEIEENSGRHPYSHLMRRAWESMELSGIFCVDRKPTVYFKEVERIDPEQIRILHRQLWNQGIATLLVVVSPKEVQVYSGLAYPAREQDEISSDHRLVEVLDRTANVLELRQFVQKVETGQIYRDYQKCFSPDSTVDQYLLDNLGKARDLLYECGGLEYRTVHALLGRLIFTCYLGDRKIINGTQFADAGARDVDCVSDLLNRYDPDEAKDILYNLFDLLQRYFNGSMFDEAVTQERPKISRNHIEALQRFLNGEKLQSGQLSFGFWVYDFSVIPIETISAIYEDFLAAESSKGQRSIGAYYTPKYLAEMVVDVAIDGWNSLIGKTFLDPACGSGIFLVILFNRIAEEWRSRNPGTRNTTRARALIEILQSCLCGVDVNETACRITCFSLYLALLDQLKPRDIHELKRLYGNVLPKLLVLKKDQYSGTESPVIFQGNFFDPDVPLPSSFDLVIGNPPWTGRGQPDDPKLLDWCLSEGNPFSTEVPKGRQARLSFFVPQKQVAHAFAWKGPLHLQVDGRACLLLPSKFLLNKTDKFQAGWFSRFTVDKIIQLSDMRFILFKHAICPAVIVRFGPNKPTGRDHPFDYDVPKVDRIDPRKGAVSILPEDRKKIDLSEVIAHSQGNEASIIWKKNLWGTPRDVRLLNSLLALPRLDDIVGTPKRPKRWIRGQGFQPFYEEGYLRDPKNYGEPKPVWWSEDHLFIDARNLDLNLVLMKSDCQRIGSKFKQLRRGPDKDIFSPPMVITNQGFSRIAYCDFPVLFQDALQSISGPAEDEDLLMFLAAVLNSKLATYFLFHTSANWGTERDKVQLFELMRLPFQLPESTRNPSRSRSIIKKVAKQIRDLKRSIEDSFMEREVKVEKILQTMEPLIYEYYEISDRERILVEDTTNILEPSSTPSSITSHIPTLKRTVLEDRKEYVNMLCEVLNSWAKRGKIKVSGEVNISTSLGVGIVTLRKSGKTSPYKESISTDELKSALKRLRNALPDQIGRFSYLRGIKIFEKNQLHIIKPLTLRHWTRTAALNDADELATAILSAGREE
ncbi:MAG: N-6 DNA methylase [Deltaproteobacteria bacterium]|nr:N-6 DNA methylase [Deltaproteobacteria bacterium]